LDWDVKWIQTGLKASVFLNREFTEATERNDEEIIRVQKLGLELLIYPGDRASENSAPVT
jgi:hypothetical protein